MRLRQSNIEVLPVPGVVLGAYPQRLQQVPRGRPPRGRALAELRTWRAAAYLGFPALVERATMAYGELETTALQTALKRVRAALAYEGFRDSPVAQAFALVRLVCLRELGITPFPTQLVAARVMLDNRLAEMATGEGKTLAAAICAATAALAGIPVHIVTANDYLVARDAQFLTRLYEALGLTVAAVTQPTRERERRAAYSCDVVYCTARELAFDYLRDGLARGSRQNDLQRRVGALSFGETLQYRTGAQLLRGLCFAVIDEADSVLIDDARVPLILSQTGSNASQLTALRRSLEIAATLEIGRHVSLHPTSMSATLASEGRACIHKLASGGEFVWHNAAHLEESVCLALAALHLYLRDRHYFVREGKVELIDECTGRTASGRVWSRGLQQLVELKEGCATSPRAQTVAQITYQRFFQRYLRLSGMSGTLREAGRELKAVYGLDVIEVPRHKTDRRIILPTRVYPNRDAQWKAVLEQTRAVTATGRPVLIGTDSVLESEELSRFLAQAALPHRVLNARQDQHEAFVIAGAGEAGQITVTTNMAGRGTDIVVPDTTARIGGLHVICCQVNSSRRIDRQLMGRCGRRGDAGSTQRLISLDKPVIWRVLPRCITERVSCGGLEHPQWLVASIISLAQWMEECRQRAQRRHLLHADLDAQNRMTFGKPIE